MSNNIKKTNNIKVIIILILMSAAPLLATDIYLPAFISIQQYYKTSMSSVQNTVTIYLLGLAFGQLVYGGMSDRFGRKKILLFGIGLYILASFLCIFSPSIHFLQFLRLLQAAGSCAGLVIGRAIIGDLFSGQKATQVFATVYPVVGLSPAIAPIIGGYATEYGWKINFIIIVLFGLITFISILSLPESLPISMRKKIRFLSLMKNYLYVAKSFQFYVYTSMISCAYAAHFAFIAGAPFIFSKFNLSSSETGYLYFSLSISYLVCNFICRSLTSKVSLDAGLWIGVIIFFIGGLYLITVAVIGFSHPWYLIVPMSIITGANGFLIPLSAAGVIRVFHDIKGAASGLMGCIQLLSASLAAFIVSILVGSSAMILTEIICGITLFAFVICLVAYSRPAITGE